MHTDVHMLPSPYFIIDNTKALIRVCALKKQVHTHASDSPTPTPGLSLKYWNPILPMDDHFLPLQYESRD